MHPQSSSQRVQGALATTAGLALLATSSASVAQSWETVHDISPGGRATAVATDHLGNLFVAGSIKVGADSPTLVLMKSSDGGQSWDGNPATPDTDEPVDAIATSSLPLAGFRAVAAARITTPENAVQDVVVSTGQATRVYVGRSNGSWAFPWLIRLSRDAGATWLTIDEYIHPQFLDQGTNTGPQGIALDNRGTIYAVGASVETVVTTKGRSTTYTYVNHWLIRRGTPAVGGGYQWTTQNFAFPVSSEYDRSANVFPSAVACVGDRVFVAGGGGNSWHVLKSTDRGASWTVADKFRFGKSGNSHAYGIAADSSGNLFVAGMGEGSVSGPPVWLVRKGTPDGIGWATVDQYQYPGGHASAQAITVDANNTVHVTGSGGSDSIRRRWITRQRSVQTGQWTTSDDFSYSSGVDTRGRGIAIDAFNTLFSVGFTADTDGNSQNWLVRRAPAP